MPRTITIALLAAALGACASAPLDEDNFLMRIPQGSKLVLNEEITIPESWARIMIQDGRVHPDRRTVDRSRPWCELETDRVARADDPNVVRPDTFETGGEIRPNLLVESEIGPVAGPIWVPGRDDGHPDRIFRTIVPLASLEQPGVKRLSCEYTENPVYYRHLTINQIRGILGDLFELRIAGT